MCCKKVGKVGCLPYNVFNMVPTYGASHSRFNPDVEPQIRTSVA